MASIRKEMRVAAAPAKVWEALRDFGNVQHLARGFVVDCRLENGARVVTFANGTTVRELLVASDDSLRRLVYAIVGGRVVAHSASMQVFAESPTHSTVVWITDVLPDEMAVYIDQQMDLGVSAMKQTLESMQRGRDA